LIDKNPTAIYIQAIQMSTEPIKIIVKIAPINHTSPAFSKILSPDFAESIFSDFLKNRVAMMTPPMNA
jgi:hypothetical protein